MPFRSSVSATQGSSERFWPLTRFDVTTAQTAHKKTEKNENTDNCMRPVWGCFFFYFSEPWSSKRDVWSSHKWHDVSQSEVFRGVWQEMKCGRLQLQNSDCGSDRNNMPQMITRYIFQGLDVVSWVVTSPFHLWSLTSTPAQQVTVDDQVLCCMLLEKKTHVIVNQERAESNATSGPSWLWAAQRSVSDIRIYWKSLCFYQRKHTHTQKKKCIYHLHKLFRVGKLWTHHQKEKLKELWATWRKRPR